MQSFVVSPCDGFAGVLNESEGIVRLVLPASAEGREIAACNYGSRFPTTAVLQIDDVGEGIELFTKFQSQSIALDFALLLFDSGVSTKTRKDAALELDELLASVDSSNYVLDILLAAPLPSTADSAGAAAASKDFGRCRSFVDAIVEAQPRVRFAYASWLSISDDQAVSDMGCDNVRGLLIQNGVFRQLVLDGKTQQDRLALNARIVVGLKGLVHPRITTELVKAYLSHLPEGVRIATKPDTISDQDDEPTQEARPIRVKEVGGADAKLAKVESQIERIAELFGQRNDQLANQFLDELVESQTRDIADHSHVVKSLCNIATKCDVRGRRDISFTCLSRARQYRTGVDSVLFMQIGHALRSIRRFDDALACYSTALELDNGVYRDSIELDKIRVAVDQGYYDEALSTLFDRAGQVDYAPSYFGLIGTLYRKMGNLRDAREFFWRALDSDHSYHVARAGLAESNKQSGRHYKAIRSYEKLLSDFRNLDEGSAKVYDQARSYLFRLTHQSNKALELLTTLNTKYPADSDVHLQLAKLYMVEGDTIRARKHFQQANGPDLHQLAADLFSIADGKIVDLPSLDLTVAESGVLPEEKGLLRCSKAMIALEQNDFENAMRVVSGPGYCDKLYSDFGTVLGYHARKKLDTGFNFKSNQVLSRIAKRGYRELKQSIAAISEDDFNSAKRFELRMCLLIA